MSKYQLLFLKGLSDLELLTSITGAVAFVQFTPDLQPFALPFWAPLCSVSESCFFFILVLRAELSFLSSTASPPPLPTLPLSTSFFLYYLYSLFGLEDAHSQRQWWMISSACTPIILGWTRWFPLSIEL